MMSALLMLCWTGLRPPWASMKAELFSSQRFGSHAEKKKEAKQEWDSVQEHFNRNVLFQKKKKNAKCKKNMQINYFNK